MKNKRSNHNIFGDLPTQKMAQKALPILVTYAQKGKTILMQELTAEIAPDLTHYNWAPRWVFSWIHTTLYELERQEDWEYGEIPGLTAIVIDRHETPTTWMDKHTRVDPNTPLSWEDYKTQHLMPVFKYPHWKQVIEFLLGKGEISMDQETFQRVTDECIRALQQASRDLSENLKTIKDASRDLQKKQEYVEKWNPSHLKQNNDLLIDFDNILPSDLTQKIQDSIKALHKFKDDYPHYRSMIEREFKRLASSELSEVERLLESDEE